MMDLFCFVLFGKVFWFDNFVFGKFGFYFYNMWVDCVINGNFIEEIKYFWINIVFFIFVLLKFEILLIIWRNKIKIKLCIYNFLLFLVVLCVEL